MRGAYAWGPFHRFWVSDPKRREIRAAPFRDRVVHHALFNVLDPIFRHSFIADSYACIAGRGTHGAVERYQAFVRARAGRGYRVQVDVRRYFASVDHAVLLERLRRRIADTRLLAVLEALIAHGADEPGRGMPIGSLTSQLFANVYLDALDHFVKEELRVRHYLRYMDDVLLLADDRREARDRLRAVRAFLTEVLRLELNPRRVIVAPIGEPSDLLGYVHYPGGRVRVRRRSVRRLWRRLPALERRGRTGDRCRERSGVRRQLVRSRQAWRCLPPLAAHLHAARRRERRQALAGAIAGAFRSRANRLSPSRLCTTGAVQWQDELKLE
ncbi:MAG: group II intron reverse transcriptase domain-containing protein [Deltaproteobacteria bacterium]|nr:group II intron reverse transcriptase domain-containing protein [Deltaproteobacteria bacterium]